MPLNDWTNTSSAWPMTLKRRWWSATAKKITSTCWWSTTPKSLSVLWCAAWKGCPAECLGRSALILRSTTGKTSFGVQATLLPVAVAHRWKSSNSMWNSKTDRFSSGRALYPRASASALPWGRSGLRTWTGFYGAGDKFRWIFNLATSIATLPPINLWFAAALSASSPPSSTS